MKAREAGKLMNSTGIGMKNVRELTRLNNSQRVKHEAKVPSGNKTQR